MPDAAAAPIQGRDFFQVRQPFDLPDEATTPDGRVFRGHRARVYWLLRLTRDRRHRHPVGQHLAPAGTVPVHLLREPWSGGQSGGRRVRELREYGVEVSITDFVPPSGGGSATTLYELAVDPLTRAPTALGRAEATGRHTPATLPGSKPRPPAGRPPERTAAVRPLTTYRFRFADAHPPAAWMGPDERAYDLTPGSPEPIAPRPGVATEAAYLEQLAELWRAGRLVDHLLGGQRRLIFYDVPLLRAPFDVRPALRRVLEACGAAEEEG